MEKKEREKEMERKREKEKEKQSGRKTTRLELRGRTFTLEEVGFSLLFFSLFSPPYPLFFSSH